MSEAYAGAGGAIRHQSSAASARGVADWLTLAAAPTFAVMALLTGTGAFGAGQMGMLCSAAHPGLTLGGMVPMYLLMSAFHAGPWLKLIAGRRRAL